MNSFLKLKNFFSSYNTLTYRKREIILRANELPSGVFFLKKGYARAYSVSEAGQELTLIIFKPEDIFPLAWSISNIPNNYYVESLTKVEIERAPQEKFLNFLKENSDVFLEITGKILTRFTGVLERMEYLAFGSAYQKIASILVICVERFGEKKNNKAVIKVPLTHKDISLLLGITRETTSLEIKKLEQKGIIDYKGSLIKVLDMKKLEEESLITTQTTPFANSV